MKHDYRETRMRERAGWDDPSRFENDRGAERGPQASGFERRRQTEEARYRQSGRGGEDWSNESSGGPGSYAPQDRPYYGHGQYGYAAERSRQRDEERDARPTDYGSPWDQHRGESSEPEPNQWGPQGMPDRASGRWEDSGSSRREENWRRQGMPDRSYGRAEYQQRARRDDERWDREEDSPYYIGREGQPSYPRSETDWKSQRRHADEVSRFGDRYEHEDRWHQRPVRSEDFRIRSLPPQSERIRSRREAEQRRLDRRDARRVEPQERGQLTRDRDVRRSNNRDAHAQTTKGSEPKRSKAATLTRHARGKKAQETQRKKRS